MACRYCGCPSRGSVAAAPCGSAARWLTSAAPSLPRRVRPRARAVPSPAPAVSTSPAAPTSAVGTKKVMRPCLRTFTSNIASARTCAPPTLPRCSYPSSICAASARPLSASSTMRSDPFRPARRVAGQRQDVWSAASPASTARPAKLTAVPGPSSTRPPPPRPSSPSSTWARASSATTRPSSSSTPPNKPWTRSTATSTRPPRYARPAPPCRRRRSS